MAILLKQGGKTTAYKTVAAAHKGLLKLADGLTAEKKEQAELFFEAGRYSLDTPFTLSTKEHPALASLDLTVTGEQAELSSLVPIQETPQKSKDIFTYQLKKEKKGGYPVFRELFVGGRSLPMSASPLWKSIDTLSPDERAGKTKREGFYAPIELARKLATAPLGGTELMVYILWIYAIFHVAEIDFDQKREVDGKTYVLIKPKREEMEQFCQICPRHVNIGASKLHFRNAPAFLTKGTFAYDHNSGVLSVKPKTGNLTGVPVERPTLDRLIEIEGMENVTVKGLRFTGTTSPYASKNMVYTHQAGGIAGLGLEGDKSMRLPEAAVLARDVRGFTVDSCLFEDIGTNGVQVSDKNVRVTVKNSVFDNISMCAVTVGNCSWNWQFERNRTYNARVENNYFRHIAYEHPACPCIYIGQVDGLKILRNAVDGCAYSAISAGWNWMPVEWEIGEKVNIRDAEIAYNRFHNFMDLLHDGGAIYVVGSNANRKTRSDFFNFMHHNYATLDEAGPVGDKYGYYLDGASSNWEMSDSVIVNCHTPIYSQPHPEALSFHNLIHRIYSTKPHAHNIHAPARDVIIKDFYLVEGDEAALFTAHPEAREIKKTAGASPKIKPTRR
ncbi:MAG: right-handed parallel beta-helix repeat-containing protein [Ruminococcaceae bacterium]|nr:right-handed parallel beta-helix repeat-containing protein [Oscillospiraceae bacterium]